MATNQGFMPSTAPNLSSYLMHMLFHPLVDRTIAAVACVPLVYGAYYRYEHFHIGLPLIAAMLNYLILVITMATRRPPKRVTPNPWYWLLAFVASYWLSFTVFLLSERKAAGRKLDYRLTRGFGIAGRHLGASEPGTQHRLCPSTTRTCSYRRLCVHAPSGLHGRVVYPSRFCAARVQSAERANHMPRRLLVHSREEPGRRGFPLPRSALRRLHAAGTGAMDSVCNLRSFHMASWRVTTAGVEIVPRTRSQAMSVAPCTVDNLGFHELRRSQRPC